MSELEVQRYIPELDHYLPGVDCHLYVEIHIDKFILDRYKDKGLIEHQKCAMAGSLGEAIKEKKFDDCITEEDAIFNNVLVRKISADIWVFSKKELEQFKEEVRAEALSGK